MSIREQIENTAFDTIEVNSYTQNCNVSLSPNRENHENNTIDVTLFPNHQNHSNDFTLENPHDSSGNNIQFNNNTFSI